MSKLFKYKDWQVVHSPVDGARIDRLLYNEVDLLTVEPRSFLPPVTDCGTYECRPVYGYDDCFPSVSECYYPDSGWIVPDHGEVCWLPWEVAEKKNQLQFRVKSKQLPLILVRNLIFSDNKLIWAFEVHNIGKKILPFQHTIHPLMPLNDIEAIELPEFNSVFDDINQKEMNLKSPEEIADFLLAQPKNTKQMLFLRGIHKGKLRLTFKNKLTLEMRFPQNLFSTIGIWWNNNGYPNEDGLRRNECAFEPISGSNSSLEDAYREGRCLFVAPGEQFKWEMEWKLHWR